MSSDERAAHLEGELADAQEALRKAATLEEWDGAHQRAQSSLSLLRPEIWVDDRERYLQLEVELEELAAETRASF